MTTHSIKAVLFSLIQRCMTFPILFTEAHDKKKKQFRILPLTYNVGTQLTRTTTFFFKRKVIILIYMLR